MTPRGSNSARNAASDAARDAVGAGARRRPSSSSTSASTATGLPSTTISGLRSTERDVGSLLRRDATARAAWRATRVAIDRGLAAERPEQRLGREVVEEVARRRARSSGTRRNATSPSASASTPPTPNITHGPNCGSRTSPAISSRVPRTIGATSSSTGPSSGRAAASSSVGRGVHRGGVAEAEPHEAAFGLVRDRVAAQLHHDRIADRIGRGDGGVGGRPTVRSSRTGTP